MIGVDFRIHWILNDGLDGFHAPPLALECIRAARKGTFGTGFDAVQQPEVDERFVVSAVVMPAIDNNGLLSDNGRSSVTDGIAMQDVHYVVACNIRVVFPFLCSCV